MAKKSFLFLSTLLLLTATSSIAMSLGRQSGVTLVGLPLDISVQAALEARDDAESLCLEAEVFYGDNRLDKSRVRVTLEKSAAAPQQALIRIRSAVLIDEPVVTLYLRAGCQLKTERRYVSLAELATETTPDRSSSVPLPAPRLAPLPMVNVPGNAASNAATLEGSPLAPKDSNLARGSSSQRTPAAARGTKAAEPAKARLKLESLDLVMERDPQLKASSELLSIPAANPLERAAANALWRALSAQPQDILRETEKLQVLENSVRNLQTQSQKALAAIDDLNGKLQQAQAERYSNALVYALAMLLLAAMAGLAYLFRTKFVHQSGESGDKPWWRKNDANQGQKKAWLDSLSSHHPEESSSSRLTSAQMLAPTGVDVDIDLDFTGSGPAGVRPADTKNLVNAVPVESKKKFGFGSAMMQPSRAVKTEELFDVQQQADFFVSIGQHDQFIELLRSHIMGNPETSALVYLDLFNLYHQLDRREEYDALRVKFNQRFNTQVPIFETYTDEDMGLEAYQLALSRIEALWPSPKVLEIIEESLFRKPNATDEAFNLEAYRELLLLYSIAKDIISKESTATLPAQDFDVPDGFSANGHLPPLPFMPTSIQPLSASVDVDQQLGYGVDAQTFWTPVVASSSCRLGLDIDLESFAFELDEAANPAVLSPSKHGVHTKPNPSAVLPGIDPISLSGSKTGSVTDNLIDFDVFDVPSV